MEKQIIKNTTHCPLCLKKTNIQLLDSNLFNLYFCKNCNNGFVHPAPKNISKYYPEIYWQNLGRFSSLRQELHNSFQKLRAHWFKKYISRGSVLDVGSGEGRFGEMLGLDFKVTNIEYPGAKVSNKGVIKVNFLNWKTDKKFDAIVFLESLEHVTNPLSYLKKAVLLLKKDGLIFIEYPRFGSIESKILGKYWLQRDIPRHLFHFTEEGLRNIAQSANLKIYTQTNIMSFQYSPYCLLASVGQLLSIQTLNLRLGIIKNLPTLLFLAIGAPLAFTIEIIFYLVGESPLGLIVLKKK
ncbi:MAG: class I SAM-dependent methyltransferase [Candidatus Daviesbacteria bacterium]|nr:class I SAM-dependent methyltransferase [Candidatus Daviesbacteria bacterium]